MDDLNYPSQISSGQKNNFIAKVMSWHAGQLAQKVGKSLSYIYHALFQFQFGRRV